MPELTDELVAVIPKSEYVDVLVHAHEKALHYVQGRLVGVLEPGRYAPWTHHGSKVDVVKVDMRQVQLPLVGQELMTRDKVTLRLSITAEYAVEDPALATHRVSSVRDAVYLIVQLAARDYVAGVTLDELLGGRDAMTRALADVASPQTRTFGVRLERVGVKDVVLPGEMRILLNRVIEAEKEAAANVILRREETAAMRSLANTARVMADNPVLLRLKELESLKDVAEKIGEVRLLMGADGLDKLLPANLLMGPRVESD
jgi:regulator of protease activity HflC (stomatin/prohibitin superfamily)